MPVFDLCCRKAFSLRTSGENTLGSPRVAQMDKGPFDSAGARRASPGFAQNDNLYFFFGGKYFFSIDATIT
jgi:hypothetical protein